jgi:hypothetical protein
LPEAAIEEPDRPDFVIGAHTLHIHVVQTMQNMQTMGGPSSGRRPSLEVCCHWCMSEAVDLWPDRPESVAGAHAPLFLGITFS